ncbi:MAG: LysE family transporter [Bacteroidales bacterium]
MIESIISVSVAGLLAGFIFSMPIAGPISILITSNALKGRLRYCILVSIGASIADFIYVLIAVFGFTKLFSFYKPAIPYIFAAGSIFFIYLGYRIIRTNINIENIEETSHLTEKIKKKERGAFYTGFLINFLNPTLFIGVLTSSFFVISLITSLGIHTGGLGGKMDNNVNEISIIKGGKTDNPKALSIDHFNNLKKLKRKDHQEDQTKYPAYFHLIISICYAFFIAFGSIIWFYLLSLMIVRFRQLINIRIISVFIKSLGAVLCLFGLFFAYMSTRMFIPR